MLVFQYVNCSFFKNNKIKRAENGSLYEIVKAENITYTYKEGIEHKHSDVQHLSFLNDFLQQK